MSTDTQVRTTTGRPPRNGARLPFSRLVVVELRKALDTRAAVVILSIAMGSGVALLAFVLAGDEAPTLDVALVPPTVLIMGVSLMGVLVMTSEWSQRTAATTFRFEPRRLRVLWAKTVAAVALSVVSVSVLLAICLGMTLLTLSARGLPVGVDGLAEGAPALVASALTMALFGVAWAGLLMNGSWAIVFVLVVGAFGDLVVILAAGDASAWFSSGTLTDALSGEGVGLLPLLVSTAIWYAAPLGAGFWLQCRREAA